MAENADLWTKLSAVSETASSLVSNFFWVATTIDLFGDLKSESALGMSYPAMGIGAALAFYTTVGSVYCHWQLNRVFQRSRSPSIHNEIDPEHLPFSINSSAPSESQALLQKKVVTLSSMQKAAIFGDWLGHVGETTGPLNMIIDLTAKIFLFQLSWRARVGINAALAVWGAIAAIADVRTCWQNLLYLNDERAALSASNTISTPDAHAKADRWTIISATAKTLSDMFSNFFWIALTIDKFGNLQADSKLGMSYEAIGIGAVCSLFITIGSVYCEAILNREHQQHSCGHAHHTPISAKNLQDGRRLVSKLKPWQNIALLGNWFGNMGDRSGPLNFALETAQDIFKFPLGQAAQIGINVGFSVWGLFGSVADARTCRQNLLNVSKEKVAEPLSHIQLELETPPRKNGGKVPFEISYGYEVYQGL